MYAAGKIVGTKATSACRGWNFFLKVQMLLPACIYEISFCMTELPLPHLGRINV